MEHEKIIQPINKVEPEPQATFSNKRAQELASVANDPRADFHASNDDYKKDVEYVKIKVQFFFFRLSILNLVFLFLCLSLFIIGIPLLIITINFYFDVNKRYKRALANL